MNVDSYFTLINCYTTFNKGEFYNNVTPSVSNYMSTFKKSHSLRKVDFEKKEV